MSLKLEWSNEQDVFEIEPAFIAKLEELLRIAGQEEGVTDGEVALTFVDDERIHELNRDYRGIDRPTDVLSFAMRESGEDEIRIVFGDEDEYEVVEEPLEGEAEAEEEADEDDFAEPLGDIIISVPRAIAQSEEYGHSVQRELGFLFVHGFLHLLGYDHDGEDQEKAMFGKQEAILQKAGLTR
ncbi:metalloprotease [Gordoniibacillus kamchatkensis]|uniref:Endoribonuclease YbeY n=1 Tax=Gordoniibacillus kamchatkensis TaxID=1590651 RepID=A0ABR5AL45_9BACL|nr:rRNA maturation RNase YbeY [Paenibacillus sp. VKM B-2647]KIL41709.1 metalloprotease [Paenibacillus sp. VKM B-2647]